MSKTKQSPRNGHAKLLHDADPDTGLEELQEIAAQKEKFECPVCGWTAELQRNECFVCEYDEPLQPVRDRGRENT